jgi:hypothetical protein
MKEMTNLETREHLFKWCEKPNIKLFEWPTDGCGYEQHIKFVTHRNKNWNGGSPTEFFVFVKEYAISLGEMNHKG